MEKRSTCLESRSRFGFGSRPRESSLQKIGHSIIGSSEESKRRYASRENSRLSSNNSYNKRTTGLSTASSYGQFGEVASKISSSNQKSRIKPAIPVQNDVSRRPPIQNKLPRKQPAPKIQMMPSLRKKQELLQKASKSNKFMQKGFPKGVLLEIGLFLCTDKFKGAIKYMRVCKTIYQQCNNQPKFWYYLYVQKYTKDFIVNFYNPIMGRNEIPKNDQEALVYLGFRFDELFQFEDSIRRQNWKDMFLKRTVESEQRIQKKTLQEFHKVFVDSWKKQNIQPLIRKLDLSFQIHVNNDIKYLISNKELQKESKFNQKPKIQLNQESLSFDLVFENHKQECPAIQNIFNIKIVAVLKKYKLLRQICEIDFSKEISAFSKKGNKNGPFMRLKMLDLEQIEILDSSSIIMGHYNLQSGNRNTQGGSKNRKNGSPPSFFTINLLYIDLLKRITKTESILNEKYCDIDSHFGLHDYTITIDLRNQKETFFSETFRKVFTKLEDIERPEKSYGPQDSWAKFHLLQSECNDRYYSNQQRFPGKPYYQFDNLITQNEKIFEMILLDLVVTDEFNEPFHYASKPVSIGNQPLFDNKMNMDLNGGFSFDQPDRESETISVEYRSGSDLVLQMQMNYNSQEDYTYITNILLKINMKAINQRFNTQY